MSIEKCPKCKTETLEYHWDYIGCEVETHVCTKCSSEFHVDIEIVRDFDNMREVAIWVLS